MKEVRSETSPFSFDEYNNLLDIINEHGTLLDYEDARSADAFIILRHDVEFSPKRAFALAEVEQRKGVSSSYFFQLSNNAYNVLSAPNIAILKSISEMGHHIGLHFHTHGMNDRERIEERIIYECGVLEDATSLHIDRFSFHRPPSFVLQEPFIIDGITNAYDPAFFTYSDQPDALDSGTAIKYIADSRNRWSYVEPWEFPCAELFETYSKVQILCHPYSWSLRGADTLTNLKMLIEEKRIEYIETMNAETKYVKDYLNEL